MTDVGAITVLPKIPIFRTAYDAYRLGLGAVFGSAKMFRFFVYGAVLLITIVSAIRYLRLSGVPYLLSRESSWRVEIDLAIELVISFLTLAAVATIQTPLGIAIVRRIIMGRQPTGTYFSLISGRDGRNFCLLTFHVYFVFLLASFAFAPLALVHGMNPVYRGDILAKGVQTPSFLLELLLAWLVAYALSSMFSTRLSFRFAESACSPSVPRVASKERPQVPLLRISLIYVAALVPVIVVAAVVYYAGVTIYIVRHRLPVSPSTSEIESVSHDMVRSVEFNLAYGVMVALLMIAYVIVAAGAARAYQIRVERGLSGIAEVFS